jgi:hypothetical protein
MPRLKSSLNKNHLETKILAVFNTNTVGFVTKFPSLPAFSLGRGEPIIRFCVPLPGMKRSGASLDLEGRFPRGLVFRRREGVALNLFCKLCGVVELCLP